MNIYTLNYFFFIIKTGDNNSTIILDNLYTSLLEKSVEQWNIETLKSIESLTKTLCSSENIQIVNYYLCFII